MGFRTAVRLHQRQGWPTDRISATIQVGSTIDRHHRSSWTMRDDGIFDSEERTTALAGAFGTEDKLSVGAGMSTRLEAICWHPAVLRADRQQGDAALRLDNLHVTARFVGRQDHGPGQCGGAVGTELSLSVVGQAWAGGTRRELPPNESA